MSSREEAEAEYYFDVSNKQWWILPPGNASWEQLSQEEAESLGLHETVLQEQCVFVETTLADYIDATPVVDQKDKGEVQSEAVRKPTRTDSSLKKIPSNSAETLTTERSSDADQSSLLSVAHSASIKVNPSRLASLSHQNTQKQETDNADAPAVKEVVKESPRKSQATSDTTLVASDDAHKLSTIEEAVDHPVTIERLQRSIASIKLPDAEDATPTSPPEKKVVPPPAPKAVASDESFVRTAVRHVTKVDTGGLGDCIRAIGEQRQRMQKLAVKKVEPTAPAPHYKRMMERARTMAAVCPTAADASKGSKNLFNDILVELRKEGTLHFDLIKAV